MVRCVDLYIFRAARQCLTLMGSSATTTSVSRRFSCLRPQPPHRSPPRWVILEGNRPSGRIASSRDAGNAVWKTRFRARRGDGDGGRGVGRTRGCPRRGPRPYRKGAIPLRYARRETASSACTPRFSIARWPRDGKIHASRAPRALEACSKELPSYLTLHRHGNNHQNDGAKKHRGVTPRLPVHLAHTHSHLPVSLDTTLLRSHLIPFAIYSIASLSTTLSLIPMPDSHSITPE